ncbi:MAG: MBL fold metallo-hydrolase [Bacteroidetes bacterium]|nr:MBL fold metallo-hydrolase [Bacteroidota bacterium]MBK9541700.1 MBL fold metallo-hydrolase [Bacteroidota bacterium]MBP6404007.1 MBL fold metallo-hydrolase [Bacteroidia bacterium]
MYVQQLYTNCLAEAAYYIESNGEAAIIDPLRETEPYIQLAKDRGATIKYVFETHFHADFVSGHIDLAKKTGAKIIYGPTAKAEYEITVAKDEQFFPLGNVKIQVLHTPGHTLESSCFLLYDDHNIPYACFTGDTLFVGEVGRPDLAVKSDLSREDLAGLLYESIQKKIKTLEDDVIVYPGHGAGSACGKNIGVETWSTIGMQKKLNYAMQPMSKEEFVHVVTDGLTEPPKYFFVDAAINKKGYEPIDDVMHRNVNKLSLEEFEKQVGKGVTILDAREADVFEKGFIPDSVNIGLNGQYAVWVGSLIDAKDPLVLVTEEGQEEEAILRLARVGYENVKGYLKGGFRAWKDSGRKVDHIEVMHPISFEKQYSPEEHVIDVRNEGEWAGGVIDGAQLIPLTRLTREFGILDKNQKYYVHCAGGYRSMMACSILRKNGFRNVVNITGGINLMKETNYKLVVPPTVHA